MKVRSRKTNRNTDYKLDDFLLKEFSKDKENWVPDEELSCNDCQDKEDLENNRDNPRSFLAKFKADNCPDPRAIKADISGFVLPEELNYQFQKVESLFTSISSNHYNLILKGDELKKLGTSLYEDKSTHLNFSKGEVKEYLKSSYLQRDWQNLLSQTDRTKWRAFIGKVLKSALIEDFGKIDQSNIDDALNIDPIGFRERINEISKYNGFNSTEHNILRPYL